MTSHRPTVRHWRDAQWAACCPDCGWTATAAMRFRSADRPGNTSWQVVRDRANRHHFDMAPRRVTLGSCNV